MKNLWETKSLSQGDLELVCLPNVGGRLWDVKFQEKSLLFQNTDLVGLPIDLKALETLPTRSPQFGFPLWGGEKTWVAPDSDWPNGAPHVMLDSAPYDVLVIDATSIEMQSKICPDSGFQIKRAVKIKSDSSWTICHELKNLNNTEKLAGIWSVMMMPQPCIISVQSADDKDVVPVFGSSSGCISHAGSQIEAKCLEPQEFKVGFDNANGHVIMNVTVEEEPLWVSCKTTVQNINDKFAHGHNFEVFNSTNYAYCEAEWHSPAATLKSGESIKFEQFFTVKSTPMNFTARS